MPFDRVPLYTRGRLIAAFLLIAVIVLSSFLPAQWDGRRIGAVLVISVPAVLVVVILGSLAVSWLVGWRASAIRRKRLENNQCEHCGGDLRGLADKCSKCGMPIWR